MATHRYDPYLWVHLAGIATIPLWLAVCGLGLAVGSPRWPALELALLGGVGVLPVLGMQLGRPFYVFSLLALTLKPAALSEDQRRLLSLFQRGWVRSLAMTAPVPLVWLLWEIYPRAVVASDITPFAPWGRLGGLAVAAVSFAMANLFLQVPVSVLAVMATSEKRFKRTVPYPLDQINARFTQAGLPLKRILPEVLPPAAAVPQVQPAAPEEVVPEAVSETAIPEGAIPEEVISETAIPDPGEVVPEAAEPQGLDTAGLEPEATLGTEVKVDEAPVWADGPPPHAEPPHPGVAIAEDDLETEAEEATTHTEPEEATIHTEPEEATVQTEADQGSWDHAHGDWDQAIHDWDQDRDWEVPVESSKDPTKDQTIDVAVVRISDPSGLSG